MPYHAEPLRPSLRWPHVEWWVPLMVACSTLQRANPDFLLFIAGRWDEGPDVLKRGWEDENLDFDEALRNMGY